MYEDENRNTQDQTQQAEQEQESSSSAQNNSRNTQYQYQQSSQPRKKKGSTGKVIAIAVIISAAVGVAAGAGVYGVSRMIDNSKDVHISINSAEGSEEEGKKELDFSSDSTGEVKEENAASGTVEAAEDGVVLDLSEGTYVVTDVTKVAEKVMPSVVSVYNNYTTNVMDFWGQTYSSESTSTGSGIIIGQTEDELLIVTNNHVVEGEDSLEVKFIDDSTASALLKGTDSDKDLAVIAVDLDDIEEDTKDQISVATIGSSDTLKIGEPAIVIGNALGYGQSVTTGVISALDREITTEDGKSNTFIQTDAAINPGNSGGALVNIAGEVVGIPSNKLGGTTIEGMGYAIPIDDAAPIIEDLMNQKTKASLSEDEQGYLGISGASVTSQVAQTYNMPTGVYVAQIMEDSGAAASDLQKGDIITKIERTSVDSMEELKNQLQYYAVGETITLTVERANGNGEYEEMEISVKLGDKSTIETSTDSEDDEEQGEEQQSRSRQVPGGSGLFHFGN